MRDLNGIKPSNMLQFWNAGVLNTSVLLLFVSLLLPACNLINPAEELPSYITIKNANILVDSASGFTQTIGLKDVWVTQGGEYLGTFELPVTFPYTERDMNTFLIQGGIFESGLSAFRLPYPFWETLTVTSTVGPLDTLVLEPTFKYKSDSQIEFEFEDDFESAGIKFIHQVIPFPPATLVKSGIDPYSGDFSGYCEFDTTRQVMDITGNIFTVNPTSDVYAELTYKSDYEFQVGIYFLDEVGLGNRLPSSVIYTPKSEWNTVYVHLVDLIRATPNVPDLELRLWIGLDAGGAEGTFHLDNVRVVAFD